jgi:hypothetical protein
MKAEKQKQTDLDKLCAEKGCSRRTAARALRQQAVQKNTNDKLALELARHVDWSDKTDIAPEIREMADLIHYHGVRSVPNAERNRVLSNLPRSLSVARK